MCSSLLCTFSFWSASSNGLSGENNPLLRDIWCDISRSLSTGGAALRKVWVGRKFQGALVFNRFCSLLPRRHRSFWQLNLWVIWKFFQEISNERTHWPDLKKTWVSNSSIATFWKGSVGIRSHSNFDEILDSWNSQLAIIARFVEFPGRSEAMAKWTYIMQF